MTIEERERGGRGRGKGEKGSQESQLDRQILDI